MAARKVLYRGQTLFNQGATHDGIYLIQTGRIRVFYTAPSGREITLAYWHPGNFVGGPEVFGERRASMVGRRRHQHQRRATARARTLRTLVVEVPNLAIGLIEGLTFKGKCYSALAQMLGTRSITERLAHLCCTSSISTASKDRRRHPDRRRLHPCRPRAYGRRHAAMGHDQPEADAGKGHRAVQQIPHHRPPARSPGGDAGRRLELD